MTLKAIIFDLDDTLLWDRKSVDIALQNTSSYAAEVGGVDPERLENDVRTIAPRLYASYETYDFAKKIGIGVFEAMWANFADPGEDFARLREIAPAYRLKVWQEALAAQQCQQAGLGKELAAMFPEQRKKCPFLFEDTVDVLKSLKEDDFELLLLTNGSPDLQNTKLSLSPVLKEYLDDIIVSGAFGVGKPDPSIFTHALEVLAVEASEVLMVGDNVKTDILGAERSGISSVLVKRHGNNASGIHATYEIKNLSELLPLVQRLR